MAWTTRTPTLIGPGCPLSAARRTRFLGYIPFDQIVDQRNSEPTVRIFQPASVPWPYVSVGVDVDIPDVDAIEPHIGALGFDAVQPYKLVLVGEKSSLAEVLGPIAESYGADLYLPTGEISDTLIHQMAKIGAEDGRPMIVLYFSDADPAGWQMPVSVARKLQAMKFSLFPELEFEVHRVALTPDQVREYALPSTPLKATEKRANDWTRATGLETEIDALASLRPELAAVHRPRRHRAVLRQPAEQPGLGRLLGLERTGPGSTGRRARPRSSGSAAD